MFRYFMEMAYNGANYHGWQVQNNAITVQEAVNGAISTLLKEDVNVVGAGRTDTGVHSSYFVAHFDVSAQITDFNHFIFKLNRILPNDVLIYNIQEVDNELHSRFSALSRTYHYDITLRKEPFRSGVAHRSVYDLDFDAMNKASLKLFDYQDFTSFSKLHTDVKTNNCKIMKAEWVQLSEYEWRYIIKADRFLRNMVRAIVGTLLDVGRNKIDINQFVNIIEGKNRCAAGSSAPPQALSLVDIEYPQGGGFKPLSHELRLRSF